MCYHDDNSVYEPDIFSKPPFDLWPVDEMDQAKKGWFSEINDLWPGQFLSLEVEKVLLKEKSDYQDILVFQTKRHGVALVLDDIIQCTERDEFAYQEMAAFLPLCAHPNPAKVLIVGGGDGGVARECDKHPLVEEVVQVEIDAKVVEACKKHLPFMAKGFSSPKLTLNIGDGFKYMKEHTNEFDVIITDSSDPIGPAVNLFTESYFKLLKGALKRGGVICNQVGQVWSGLDEMKHTLDHCRKHFAVVKYATTNVPTYPMGQIGFAVAGDDDVAVPKYRVGEEEVERMGLKYYNAEVHSAAFVMPNFVKNVFYK